MAHSTNWRGKLERNCLDPKNAIPSLHRLSTSWHHTVGVAGKSVLGQPRGVLRGLLPLGLDKHTTRARNAKQLGPRGAGDRQCSGVLQPTRHSLPPPGHDGAIQMPPGSSWDQSTSSTSAYVIPCSCTSKSCEHISLNLTLLLSPINGLGTVDVSR